MLAFASAASFTFAACIRTEPNGSRDVGDEVLVWDYLTEESARGTSLWPSDPGVPTRLKRQMHTAYDGPLLVADIEGTDPAFIWQFNEAPNARGLALEFEASHDGRLQVFWTTQKCRVFSEDCSTISTFSRGEGTLVIPFPFRESLRELRLDPPGEPGMRLAFRSIRFVERPVSSSVWEPNAQTTVARDGEGLRVSASTADPWIITERLSLDAAAADTLELQLSAPSGSRPQLFWTNASCPNFSEECSLLLQPAEEPVTAQWASLDQHPKWTGTIGHLRIDPGDKAGDYRIHRIALRSTTPP